MAIKIDVRSRGIESGYETKPFDESKALLESRGYDIISLKQLADLRIARGKDSHVANWGGGAREAFVYDRDRGFFLVRNSPIMVNAKEATECSRHRREFYLTPEQVELSLGNEGVDSIKFKNRSLNTIPFNRFGEDERTVFAFGNSAQPYGDFLEEAMWEWGVSEMHTYLSTVNKKSFARQVWLSGVCSNWHGLGNYRDGLDICISLRGIRNNPKSNQ